MDDEPLQRRLAAILAADVVGYTHQMRADESGTFERLRARRKELFEPEIANHGGRIFKLTGDGIYAEFGSVVDAVKCAAILQAETGKRNGGLPDNHRIDVRIGVHAGDVIIDGEDRHGDVVNVASRLEQLAEPGAICVSQQVVDHARQRAGLAFESMGEKHLKGIAEPVWVYRVRLQSPAAAERPTLALPDKPSIAVLPFQNLSGDPEQEYFADGVVEEITTALSRFHHMFVIARNSSFAYKGHAVDVKKVGRELGVRYVLEGSVRKAGSRVRIVGQLVDATTGAHLWADRFEGTLEDIFDLQDRVTASVVGALAPKLEQAEIERARRKPTESLDAYEYFLRGLAVVHRMTREANDEALRLFSKAIERDPEFAPAYATAAHCYPLRKMHGWTVDRAQEVAEAARLAQRAIELGRDDAVALCYGGLVIGYVVGNLDDGAALVDRALALNSNLAAAWSGSGWFKLCFGEPEVAIERAARAMRLSPLDTGKYLWQSVAALAHLCTRRYDAAAALAEAALLDHPNYAFALRVASASHALAGRLAEAQKVMARLRQVDPHLRIANLGGVVSPLRRPGDLDHWIEGLRKAGLPD
jgi:adenylate cyclase